MYFIALFLVFVVFGWASGERRQIFGVTASSSEGQQILI
jgi:hypothetical protein